MEGMLCEDGILSMVSSSLICHLGSGVLFCIGLYHMWRLGGKQPFHNNKFVQLTWMLGWNFCIVAAFVLYLLLFVWCMNADPETRESALFPPGEPVAKTRVNSLGLSLSFVMLVGYWGTTFHLKLLWVLARTESDASADPALFLPWARDDQHGHAGHRLEQYPLGRGGGEVTPQPSLPGPFDVHMAPTTRIGSDRDNNSL